MKKFYLILINMLPDQNINHAEKVNLYIQNKDSVTRQQKHFFTKHDKRISSKVYMGINNRKKEPLNNRNNQKLSPINMSKEKKLFNKIKKKSFWVSLLLVTVLFLTAVFFDYCFGLKLKQKFFSIFLRLRKEKKATDKKTPQQINSPHEFSDPQKCIDLETQQTVIEAAILEKSEQKIVTATSSRIEQPIFIKIKRRAPRYQRKYDGENIAIKKVVSMQIQSQTSEEKNYHKLPIKIKEDINETKNLEERFLEIKVGENFEKRFESLKREHTEQPQSPQFHSEIQAFDIESIFEKLKIKDEKPNKLFQDPQARSKPMTESENKNSQNAYNIGEETENPENYEQDFSKRLVSLIKQDPLTQQDVENQEHISIVQRLEMKERLLVIDEDFKADLQKKAEKEKKRQLEKEKEKKRQLEKKKEIERQKKQDKKEKKIQDEENRKIQLTKEKIILLKKEKKLENENFGKLEDQFKWEKYKIENMIWFKERKELEERIVLEKKILEDEKFWNQENQTRWEECQAESRRLLEKRKKRLEKAILLLKKEETSYKEAQKRKKRLEKAILLLKKEETSYKEAQKGKTRLEKEKSRLEEEKSRLEEEKSRLEKEKNTLVLEEFEIWRAEAEKDCQLYNNLIYWNFVNLSSMYQTESKYLILEWKNNMENLHIQQDYIDQIAEKTDTETKETNFIFANLGDQTHKNPKDKKINKQQQKITPQKIGNIKSRAILNLFRQRD